MLNQYKADVIEKHFKFDYNIVDFFYAYCNAKGIDNPEEDLTDEEYDKLETECCEKITNTILDNLRRAIMQDINERIEAAMEAVVEKERR